MSSQSGSLAGRLARQGARRTAARLRQQVGGPARLRVIVLLGAVLALNSADQATIGAVGAQLEDSLHIDNTQLGLIASVGLLVAAVATIPVGMLVDRVSRTKMLLFSIVLWSAAMIASAAAGDFDELLLTRIALGAVTATAGPAVASLTGDLFPARERARIYGYLLSGELIGLAFGFVVSGGVAGAISWRAAFIVLALPEFLLVYFLWRDLPEPGRGGQSRLAPGATRIVRAKELPFGGRYAPPPGAGGEEQLRDDGLAQSVAGAQGVQADPEKVLRVDPVRMRIWPAVRYVLSLRTNVMLIIASALGYFFLGGLETFAVVFIRGHFGLGQTMATLLLVVIGLGAVVGVLVGGRLADRMLRRGRLSARLLVAAVGYGLAAVLFIPGLTIDRIAVAVPILFVATAALAAPNAPLDAARLDIMHARLWGRAESVRTVLRTVAAALAPLLFGAISDLIAGRASGGGFFSEGAHPVVSSASAHGLEITFLIMLVPLFASALFVRRGIDSYPQDVATAAASEEATLPGREPRHGAAL